MALFFLNWTAPKASHCKGVHQKTIHPHFWRFPVLLRGSFFLSLTDCKLELHIALWAQASEFVGQREASLSLAW